MLRRLSMALHALHGALVYVACGFGLSMLGVGWAQAFDEFGDDRAPCNFVLGSGERQLFFKGQLKLALHDLEGKGGPGYDSITDFRTIGTRSPFVEVEAFRLALRLQILPGLNVNSEIEFAPAPTEVLGAWFDWVGAGPLGLWQHVEAGRHTPFVTIDRRTARYPLAATIYWREPEMHLTYEVETPRAASFGARFGVSAAMARPLGFAGVQESAAQRGSINVLVYDAERVYSGVGPMWGAKLGLRALALELEAFGFVGRLADEGGVDELESNFDNYKDLYGVDASGAAVRDRRLMWGGGRVTLTLAGVHALLEGIASREGRLARATAYGELSYRLVRDASAPTLSRFEPLVRYEVYRLRHSDDVHAGDRALRSPAPSQSVTWDFTVTTVALISELYRDLLELRLEYYLIHEDNGVGALGIPTAQFRNNEFLAQLELRF